VVTENLLIGSEPSPKSQISSISLAQSFPSPINDLFLKEILVLMQLVSIDSNFATEGSNIITLSTLKVVVLHALFTYKVIINSPLGSEQLIYVQFDYPLLPLLVYKFHWGCHHQNQSDMWYLKN
jgi:hypothetical protein